MKITKVVFRKYPDGEILALFPYEEWSDGLVTSYQHLGQHGGADYLHCIKETTPAMPSEYKSLLSELLIIGYVVEPIHVDFEGNEIELDETPLPDDHPVYGDYLYVCDGKVVRCDLFRGTVADLKRDVQSYYGIKVEEVTTCDIVGRRKMYK